MLFKSAHTRGGWADNIRIHDLTLDAVSVPIHITMNWNPSYSYAKIPAGLTHVPPYYKVLATPVPAAEGRAHFHNVHIWNIHATGARRAFAVSAMPQAPLVHFHLDHIQIAARSAGSIGDIRQWTLSDVDVQTQDGSKVQFRNAQNVSLKANHGFNRP